MEKIVDWLTETPINHFDILQLMEHCPTLLDNRHALNWKDAALMDVFRQKAAEHNLPPLINLLLDGAAQESTPTLDFQKGADGIVPAKTTLMQHAFKILHSNHILAYFLSETSTGGVCAFVQQEVLLQFADDSKVQRFISNNFDVVYNGSDVKLFEEGGKDGLVKYFDLLGRLAHRGGPLPTPMDVSILKILLEDLALS
jgi:hypothetical protein